MTVAPTVFVFEIVSLRLFVCEANYITLREIIICVSQECNPTTILHGRSPS